MTRRINIPLVLGYSILVGVLTILTFFFAFGKDEGTLGDGIFRNLIADSFNLFRFPTHAIFWKLFSSSALLYFLGLMLNCLFYGILIERIIYFVPKQATKA